MDVGGGVMVSSPSTGLSVDGRLRMLLVHQAERTADDKHRLAALARKVADEGMVLTEARVAAIERNRDDEEASGDRDGASARSRRPGQSQRSPLSGS